MASYNDLINQAQALMAQAEQLRKQELANVVTEIKAKMKEYGITVADLAGALGRKAGGAKDKAEGAKYRGPNGELWKGGPGRKPEWVKEVLAKGQDINDYRI